MRILSVQLNNIKSHRERFLNFSAGINVLCGPNGIGKSTIFEAIGYALFGVDAQSFVGNVERFVSIGQKKGEVRVEFQPAETEKFLVSRTVGVPSKWLLHKQVSGEYEVEEHKDGKETETRLKQLLGLDNGRSLAEQFEMVIGPFQNDFLGPFVIKQATKRRDKFDEILGIDTWRKTFSETKVLASTIRLKTEVLQAAISPLQEQLKQLEGVRNEQQAAQQSLVNAEDELINKQQRSQQLEEAIKLFVQKERVLKELTADLEKLQARIVNGGELISSQHLSVSAAESACKVLADNQDAKESFEQAEAKLLSLREQHQQQRILEKESAELRSGVEALRGQLRAEVETVEQVTLELGQENKRLVDLRTSLVTDQSTQESADCLPEVRAAADDMRAQLGKLEGHRSGLLEGSEKLAEGICPFFKEACKNIAASPQQDVFSEKFSSLEKEHFELNRQLEELLKREQGALQAVKQLQQMQIRQKELEEQAVRLAERQAGLGKRRRAVEKLKEQLEEKQNFLASKNSELENFSRLQKDIEDAEAEKLRHQVGRDLFVENQQQAGELDKRRAELGRYERHLEELRNDQQHKQQEQKSVREQYDAEQHQSLGNQKEQVAKEVGALEQHVQHLQKELKRFDSEIEKLLGIETEIKAKRSEINDYAEKEKLVKFLRNKVFRNVSAYLSERFRNEISQRADRIYRTISQVDEELFWGENYQIVLRDMDAGEIRERVDDQLSGGQTMSAVVALRLALLQTIGARIAFFDEPTSNLDVTRRENLAHAFRAIDVGREEVTEHWYDQLFLISHDVAFTEITDQIVALDS